MTAAIIAIKGDHSNNTDLIFEALNYTDTKSDKHFNSFSEYESYLYANYNDLALKGIFIRGIWQENGWILISDPDMADPIYDENLLLISQKLNTPVYGFVLQPEANSYVFSFFDGGKNRGLIIDDFYVKENSGDPIPEEQGLNFNESTSEKDLIAVAERLGFQLEPRSLMTQYTIKELNHTAAFKKEVEKYAPAIPQSQPEITTKKSWWKLW